MDINCALINLKVQGNLIQLASEQTSSTCPGLGITAAGHLPELAGSAPPQRGVSPTCQVLR
jgi:hypothetical protein